MTLLEACRDPELFRRWFRDPATWGAWFAFIAALFAEPMTEEEQRRYREHTGRDSSPCRPFAEGWLICGRRAGKSFVLALIAVYLACFRQYAQCLGPGERATIIIIAADRRQARTIYRFVRGLIAGTPLLRSMLQGEPRADSLDLTNSVTIEVGTASFRTSRGYSFAAVLCDELAFWPTDDSAEPDYAVLDALRPGMANIPGSMLLCASSPYARRGALWDAYRRYHGKDDADVLVWKATTREMNPTVPEAVIQRAYERDPASAGAEFGAAFRSDREQFLTREALEAATDVGTRERAPLGRERPLAFVDPSGGSADSMTLAIAYRDGDTQMLACLRERRAPFNPEECVAEFVQVLKQYRVTSVTGDAFAGEWPREAFRRHGITYKRSDLPKTAIYQAALPLINSATARLLDHPVLLTQLVTLERRTARGGRDSIDHPPGSRDDVANAACGALVLAARPEQRLIVGVSVIDGNPWWLRNEPSRPRAWARRFLDENGIPISPPSPIKAGHDV